MSIGRNPLALLQRLRKVENIRLVDPYTSSHELIRTARAVAVISSTVGLEALLHGRPVLPGSRASMNVRLQLTGHQWQTVCSLVVLV